MLFSFLRYVNWGLCKRVNLGFYDLWENNGATIKLQFSAKLHWLLRTVLSHCYFNNHVGLLHNKKILTPHY